MPALMSNASWAIRPVGIEAVWWNAGKLNHQELATLLASEVWSVLRAQPP